MGYLMTDNSSFNNLLYTVQNNGVFALLGEQL